MENYTGRVQEDSWKIFGEASDGRARYYDTLRPLDKLQLDTTISNNELMAMEIPPNGGEISSNVKFIMSAFKASFQDALRLDRILSQMGFSFKDRSSILRGAIKKRSSAAEVAAYFEDLDAFAGVIRDDRDRSGYAGEYQEEIDTDTADTDGADEEKVNFSTGLTFRHLGEAVRPSRDYFTCRRFLKLAREGYVSFKGVAKRATPERLDCFLQTILPAWFAEKVKALPENEQEDLRQYWRDLDFKTDERRKKEFTLEKYDSLKSKKDQLFFAYYWHKYNASEKEIFHKEGKTPFLAGLRNSTKNL